MGRQTLAAALGEPPTPDVPEGPPETWREQFKRNWLQLRGMAYDMVMLDKFRRQNRQVRETVNRIQRGTLGKDDPTIESEPEDDMGLSLGNTVHHHYPEEKPPEQKPTSGMPGWMAALLAGSTALAGAAGWSLFGPKPESPPAKVEVSQKPTGNGKSDTLDPGGFTIEVVKPEDIPKK